MIAVSHSDHNRQVRHTGPIASQPNIHAPGYIAGARAHESKSLGNCAKILDFYKILLSSPTFVCMFIFL